MPHTRQAHQVWRSLGFSRLQDQRTSSLQECGARMAGTEAVGATLLQVVTSTSLLDCKAMRPSSSNPLEGPGLSAEPKRSSSPPPSREAWT